MRSFLLFWGTGVLLGAAMVLVVWWQKWPVGAYTLAPLATSVGFLVGAVIDWTIEHRRYEEALRRFSGYDQ